MKSQQALNHHCRWTHSRCSVACIYDCLDVVSGVFVLRLMLFNLWELLLTTAPELCCSPSKFFCLVCSKTTRKMQLPMLSARLKRPGHMQSRSRSLSSESSDGK